MLTPDNLCAELERRLEAADLDGGLTVISGIDVPDAIHRAGPRKGRLAYMSADVLDYGGRYEMSKKVLENVGQQARDRVTKFLRERSSNLRLLKNEADERKDEAWTVIQLGMCFYRSGEQDYPEALQCFEDAREALFKDRGVRAQM